ncbi:hypothetical protein D6D04_05120 [Aureobasidium pullulans]|nr:hypothetical protein D6D04_05120 [Aureobasidium pullulans]
MKEQDKPNIPNPFPFFPATEGTSKKAVAQSDVVRGGNLVDASFANKIDPYQRPAGQNPSAGLTHGSSSQTEEHAPKGQCSSVSPEDQREAREAPRGQQVSPEVVRQSLLTERNVSEPSDLLPQLKPGNGASGKDAEPHRVDRSSYRTQEGPVNSGSNSAATEYPKGSRVASEQRPMSVFTYWATKGKPQVYKPPPPLTAEQAETIRLLAEPSDTDDDDSTHEPESEDSDLDDETNKAVRRKDADNPFAAVPSGASIKPTPLPDWKYSAQFNSDKAVRDSAIQPGMSGAPQAPSVGESKKRKADSQPDAEKRPRYGSPLSFIPFCILCGGTIHGKGQHRPKCERCPLRHYPGEYCIDKYNQLLNCMTNTPLSALTTVPKYFDFAEDDILGMFMWAGLETVNRQAIAAHKERIKYHKKLTVLKAALADANKRAGAHTTPQQPFKPGETPLPPQ